MTFIKNAFCIAIGLAAVSLYFMPVLSDIQHTVPSSYADLYHFIWNGWYVAQRLGSSESLYTTDLVFHPFGARLELHSLTEGLLVPIAMLGLSPIATFNLAVIISFALNYLAAFYLFNLLSGSYVLATLLGLALTFHPYLIGHLDGAHLNFLVLFPLLLFAYAIAAYLKDEWPAWGAGTLAATSLAFLAFNNLYYFYYILMGCAAMLLWFIIALRWQHVCFIAASLLASLAISGWRLYHTAELALSHSYTPDHDPLKHSADLMHFLRPAVSLPGLNSAESGVYLGWAAVVAAVLLILMATRRAAPIGLSAMALIFAALALGPAINFKSLELQTNPVYLLLSALPLFPSVPARFAIVAVILLFAVTAWGFKHVHSLRRALIALALVLCIELFPVKPHTTTLPSSPALSELATLRVRAIHDATLPIERRMYHQTIHGKPITDGFLARRPRAAEQAYRQNAFLRFLKGKDVSLDEARQGFDELQIDGVLVESSSTEVVAALDRLKWLQVAIFSNELTYYSR